MEDPPVNPPGRETKAWEDASGAEDLTDKVGNAGDDIRTDLGRAGDDLRDTTENDSQDANTEARENDANRVAGRRRTDAGESPPGQVAHARDAVPLAEVGRDEIQEDVLLVAVDTDGDADVLVVVKLPDPPYNPPDNSRKVSPDLPKPGTDDRRDATPDPG